MNKTIQTGGNNADSGITLGDCTVQVLPGNRISPAPGKLPFIEVRGCPKKKHFCVDISCRYILSMATSGHWLTSPNFRFPHPHPENSPRLRSCGSSLTLKETNPCYFAKRILPCVINQTILFKNVQLYVVHKSKLK